MREIQESGEMYLETILVLSREKANVRSIDVANYMGFSKPSVSRGVSILRDAGYINVDESGFLSLTKAGEEIAEKIYERHTVLSDILQLLGVSKEVATKDACKIEHAISDESFNAIKKFVKKDGKCILPKNKE